MFTRTERLFLRPAWPEDWEELLPLAADEGLARNLASVPWPYGEADARAFVAGAFPPRYPRWLIAAPGATGAPLVGCIGLDPHDGGGAELGYWIGSRFAGRGYATEAARAVARLAADLLGHRRLVARTFVDNPASARVLGRAGFRPTGVVAPCFSLARGTSADAVEYARDIADGAGCGDDDNSPPMQRAA